MIKAFKQRKISILLEPLATSTRINYDENGQNYGGEYNDPAMEDKLQHQEHRPKYNSA